MDKLDDLKAELKAMEKLAKILHELPTEDSVVRVAAWLQEVMRTDLFKPAEKLPAAKVVEQLLQELSPSELVHIQSLLAHMDMAQPEVAPVPGNGSGKRISIEELPASEPKADNPVAVGLKAAQGVAPGAEVASVSAPAQDQIATQGF